jgi:hypothetical protein
MKAFDAGSELAMLRNGTDEPLRRMSLQRIISCSTSPRVTGRNINSTTTSLIFVQPLNNLINSSYLRPSFSALCLAVKDDPDIVEWIEYHGRKGCSNPPLSHLIRQYIDKSIYIVEEMKPSILTRK